MCGQIFHSRLSVHLYLVASGRTMRLWANVANCQQEWIARYQGGASFIPDWGLAALRVNLRQNATLLLLLSVFPHKMPLLLHLVRLTSWILNTFQHCWGSQMGKHWKAFMCLKFWPIAANFGNGNWYWQRTQGPRHDYHFGIFRSWQPVSFVSPVLSNTLVCVSVMGSGDSENQDSSQVDVSRVSSHPPLVCSPFVLFCYPPFLCPRLCRRSRRRSSSLMFAWTEALSDGGYLTWHQVSAALFTHRLGHTRASLCCRDESAEKFCTTSWSWDAESASGPSGLPSVELSRVTFMETPCRGRAPCSWVKL